MTTVATLAYSLVAADTFVATWSLIAGDPWDWDRFWLFFCVAALGSVASSFGEALARRSALPSRPQARAAGHPGHDAENDDETTEAMRTGCLPPDAEPALWRARISRQVGRAHLLLALMTGLCVTSAVLTAAVAHLHDDDDPVLWGLSILTLLFVAPVLWLLARVHHRARRLRERL